MSEKTYITEYNYHRFCAWKVQLPKVPKQKQLVKYFAWSRYPTKELALQAATTWRDEMLDKLPLEYQNLKRVRRNQISNTGVAGVSLIFDARHSKPCYGARWQVNLPDGTRKQVHKRFSFDVFDEKDQKRAFREACLARAEGLLKNSY